MNLLQQLPGDEDFFVTLNPHDSLSRVWSEREYSHPVFTRAARAAQQRQREINGAQRTFYCGAYWGWGFHEDGFASAGRVADAFEERLQHAA
jgi:predicted NAD/FAD-binding protein